MKILGKYKNGNAEVCIFNDGSRIIETQEDEFKFEVPCNMDIKITNYCEKGCPMCHENSTPEGRHAPLENFEFLKSWGAYKECAFGGGMVTSYPHLEELLTMTKELKLIANATFHQEEFIDNIELIKSYQDRGLLHGIGVSFMRPDPRLEECAREVKNLVFHVIAGLITLEDLNYLSTHFEKPKILILGYKHFRRGNIFYEKIGDIIESKIQVLSENFTVLRKQFSVMSFDNLALEQLHIKSLVSNVEWDMFYQGEEGSSNMYVDAVEGKFARNSTSEERFSLRADVKEMFDIIKR